MDKIIFLISLLIIAGCGRPEPELIGSVDAGSVTDARLVPTSWNEQIKSIVVTDKGVFMVLGMSSVMKHEAAKIQKYDNGRRYLCVESWGNCRLLIN